MGFADAATEGFAGAAMEGLAGVGMDAFACAGMDAALGGVANIGMAALGGVMAEEIANGVAGGAVLGGIENFFGFFCFLE